MPGGEHVLRCVEAVPGLVVRGENVGICGTSFPGQFTEILHHIIAERYDALVVVFRHLRRDAEEPCVEIDVANPEHEDLFWPDQVFEIQPDHGDVFVHPAFVEVVEDSPAVLLRDGHPSLGFPFLPFERGKRVVRCKPVSDKRPEQALQELEHAVVGVGAPPAVIIFVEDVCRMAAGEASAEPLGNAGFIAPSGEERQFGPVAAHGVLAEVFGLPADMVCGCLHDGDPFRGCGIFADQRVPAVIEFTIYLGAEQCGVSVLLPAVLNAVAAYAHALEFVGGGVEHIVKDVDLFVLSDLRGSEIDEWCFHDVSVDKNYYCIYL